MSYRVRVRVTVPKYQLVESEPNQIQRSIETKGTRQVYFEAEFPITTTIYERDALEIGAVVHGPAIFEQFDATTVVPPQWRARVDVLRNLVLEKD